MTTLSAALMLFLVFDPVGNIPNFLAVLKDVPAGRRTKIIIRENAIALAVLLLFLAAGRYLLQLLGISGPSLSIAGGIILFLIALRMIFTPRDGMFGEVPGGEPLIVPLAVPLVAGPSAISTVMVIVNRRPDAWALWLGALGLAWLASCLILLASGPLGRLLGSRVLAALEKVMGMLLTVIAVQMFLGGLKEFMAG